MITRTVQSPAGETITLYRDDEFREVLADEGRRHNGGMFHLSTLRREILAALYFEGAVRDPQSGRAATMLLERAVSRGLPADTNRFAVANVMASPAMSLCIERDVRNTSRRTYSVRLIALPDTWYHELIAAHPDELTNGSPPIAPESAGGTSSSTGATELDDVPTNDVEPVVPELPAQPPRPVLEMEVAGLVASALMAQCVEIIAGGAAHPQMIPSLRNEISNLEDRLGQQILYVEKLRRQVRDAGDEIAALKLERDGLRQRARAAEHNLKVATSGDAQRIIDVEVRRQLDRIMRQTPAGARSKIAVG